MTFDHMPTNDIEDVQVKSPSVLSTYPPGGVFIDRSFWPSPERRGDRDENRDMVSSIFSLEKCQKGRFLCFFYPHDLKQKYKTHSSCRNQKKGS